MKIVLLTLAVLSAALGIGLARSSRADEPSAPAATSMQDLLRPGPEHALLQKLVGEWDTIIVTQAANGAEQRTHGSTTRVKETEFHTVETCTGELMGVKLVGHGIEGYCPLRKQFYTFWIDSMTPSPMTLFGDYDSAKRELTMKGECFGMSGKLEPCRTVTRFQDDDHYTYALYGSGPDGREVRHVLVEYTRKR